ncbi:MAG TPA: DUF2795 domain-containing protein [Gammaproteobacteria bacterium]|jgi:hypothetical protein|nr:DUF2795 domain-containing protein [Gammaproteobacteria bacterium]
MQQTSTGGRSPNEIAQVLKGLNFPAQKDEVVHQAEANQADGGILDMLRHLPPGAYNSLAEVMERIGLPSGAADMLKGFGSRH